MRGETLAFGDTAWVEVLREGSDDEMVLCYLAAELSSERFGAMVRAELDARDLPVSLLTDPDLADTRQNLKRKMVLAATRGYGEDREMFEHFPSSVVWTWVWLEPADLARVRYVDYSYWNELSNGTRVPLDAANNIAAGVEAFDVPNGRFLRAAEAVRRGQRLPLLILAGPTWDGLVCLEGHLRLTAYALARFPVGLECLVAASPALDRWAQ